METWITQLISIILIDLVLAGDNAVVMALASRNLPPEQRKKAIFWGTFGAVGLRIALTSIAVFLLKVPLLMAIGGLLLLHIAVKLIADDGEEKDIQGASNLKQAIKTIIVADLVMSLDNVLAIAGAAHGSFTLIIVGLLISIPIVVWGSQLITNLLHKYPVLVYVGSGIIAYTAASMFLHDPMIKQYIPSSLTLIIEIATVVLVLTFGKWKKSKGEKVECC